MRAYVYQAALLCENCGEAQRELLTNKGLQPARDAGLIDSDRWPQGPYADGGGEADCPQHCDHCGVFLENPLTSDGYEYVRERLRAHDATYEPRTDVLTVWADFYAGGLDAYEADREDAARAT